MHLHCDRCAPGALWASGGREWSTPRLDGVVGPADVADIEAPSRIALRRGEQPRRQASRCTACGGLRCFPCLPSALPLCCTPYFHLKMMNFEKFGENQDFWSKSWCEALLEKNRSSKIALILEKLKTGENLQNRHAKLSSTGKYFEYQKSGESLIRGGFKLHFELSFVQFEDL